jgi:hypothetical protein
MAPTKDCGTLTSNGSFLLRKFEDAQAAVEALVYRNTTRLLLLGTKTHSSSPLKLLPSDVMKHVLEFLPIKPAKTTLLRAAAAELQNDNLQKVALGTRFVFSMIPPVPTRLMPWTEWALCRMVRKKNGWSLEREWVSSNKGKPSKRYYGLNVVYTMPRGKTCVAKNRKKWFRGDGYWSAKRVKKALGL